MTINEILEKTKNLSWQENLKFVAENFSDVTFSSSFSIEDQVITDFIAQNNLAIEIFTLDTGRLPKETYAVWQSTLDKYKVKIAAFYPNQEKLEDFITEKGINPFYESLDLRKSCCGIRKVEPLHRALKGKKLWISGLRKEHSITRVNKDFFEKDDALNLIKFYPLLDLSEEEIWKYIEDNRVPFNRLYKQGYRSIGCDPCSRAIGQNDDIRAGRWWWENPESKECGLHK
jgi:phosphoadenosine phosphosulfate reductase